MWSGSSRYGATFFLSELFMKIKYYPVSISDVGRILWVQGKVFLCQPGVNFVGLVSADEWLHVHHNVLVLN